MEIRFEKEYLSELYYKGASSNRKYWFQPQVIKKYKIIIDILESVNSIEELFRYNSLRYEVLSGDKKGVSSVRVNNQYRIEFTVSQVVSETVVTICNIQELSNHYK
jgi:proteic killer suppression protein